MKKIIIFGNSGSGKSTLAKKLCSDNNLAHLDLDLIAWVTTSLGMPQRMSLSDSKRKIDNFIDKNNHKGWVIEGCYADLLAIVDANEAIYMDLPIGLCVENAKNRPWEAHKYETKKAQDDNLDMLINWIQDYDKRRDTFSKLAHTELFEQFNGDKVRCLTNLEEGFIERQFEKE